MGRISFLSGKKFGKLTVVERTPERKRRNVLWKCRCDCGEEILVRGTDLKSGHVRSCGCLSKEVARMRQTKHGRAGTRIYNIWEHMKQRCYSFNDKAFKNYGERGIKVCNEWKSNFESFYKWAIENGYTEKLTLDRIDVNGNYEPSNCRWITQQEQNFNKRNSCCITYNGKTQTVAEWSKETNIAEGTIRSRLRMGWNIERVLTKNVKK